MDRIVRPSTSNQDVATVILYIQSAFTRIYKMGISP
jgi:hypothetical protein